MTAYIIHFALSALFDYQVNGSAVVVNMEPVSYIESFAVNGQGLVFEGLCNHKGNQFFGELIRAVIVGAA